jgi:3-methyl-2-oxobutanoate hydroxymethyltransferase
MAARVTVPEVRDAKGQQPLVMLTAYDAPTTRWGEAAGADLLLVGDSLAMVVLGHETTLEVTLDEMLHHARAVTRTARRCLVVGDLPFGSYQVSVGQAVESAVRFVKEAGVQAVKLEGHLPDQVRAVVQAGIPVMGHLGLTPQSVHRMGGYLVQGRTVDEALSLLAAARDLEAAGCFALVLEGVPAEVAARITDAVAIPTIGIGAGADCDGQVLVIHDLLGITPPPRPRFVAAHAELGEAAVDAASRWAQAVRSRELPAAEQSYGLSRDEAERWQQVVGGGNTPTEDQ